MWTSAGLEVFCDQPAYGKQTKEGKERLERLEHSSYVPALACPDHGGPPEKLEQPE